MGPRILIIDGNVAEIRARQLAALGYDSGVGYARVLHRIDPSLRLLEIRNWLQAEVLSAKMQHV
jgi:hypothetical protein